MWREVNYWDQRTILDDFLIEHINQKQLREI